MGPVHHAVILNYFSYLKYFFNDGETQGCTVFQFFLCVAHLRIIVLVLSTKVVARFARALNSLTRI